MKRRVNIAIGLIHHPRLLFLDEPTVGVDPQSRNHIFESVLKLNKERGMSIIYTSHYMEEVELLCSRAAIIDEGKIIAMDTIKNLIAMLGGGVIQVGVDHIDDALVADLGRLPNVKSAARLAPAKSAEEGAAPVDGGGLIKISAENSHKAVVGVISLLGERGARINSLEILEPNLESVFLHLTGKKLRE